MPGRWLTSDVHGFSNDVLRSVSWPPTTSRCNCLPSHGAAQVFAHARPVARSTKADEAGKLGVPA